jgi:lipoprotein NlpD
VNVLRLLIVAVCIALFAFGCSSNKDLKRTSTNTYIVQKGDTLFSISFRYGIDFKKLARWNRISHPYTIYPGQRIRLFPRAGDSGKVAKTTNKKTTTSTKSAPPAEPKVSAAKPPGDWRWPVKGKLIERFSANNNGIDIAAAAGTPIVATSSGKVVYAGNGLRGYGNLLIIKHNRSYFSAYAHSERLLVTEGTQVKAGQKIAEVGRTGTDRDKLHFEIRKDGNPEDPLRFLPR